MIGHLSLLLLMSLGAADVAFAKDRPSMVVLQPSSNWYLDYADGYCRLARQFGVGDHKTVFYLEQYEPDNRFTVLVAGPDFVAEKVHRGKLRFGVDGAEALGERLKAKLMDGYGEGVSIGGMGLLPNANPLPGKRIPAGSTDYQAPPSPTSLAPADVAHISYFELLEGDRPVARLELGRMSEPVKAMNACTEELLTHWGIDVVANRTRKRAPEPTTSPATWISYSDYPKELLREGREGTVYFRLDVDETGKATGCHVQQSTRPDGFDEAVCKSLMRRARFEPALGADGKPIPSYWRSSVSFQIPS